MDHLATAAPTLGNTHIQKVELSTNNGASYFNAGVDLGTGFVNGDPLKDVKVLKQVPFVMAAGKVFKQ